MWENIERHTKKLLDEKFKEICKYCQAKDWQCVWNLVKSVAAHSQMFWKHVQAFQAVLFKEICKECSQKDKRDYVENILCSNWSHITSPLLYVYNFQSYCTQLNVLKTCFKQQF